ncbi:hypothetical protein LUW74_14520 [Actinomadura madurae]|uniref:hypothetical protein n=1 Tax=Actinomadura madurae TaxID=1993 RepID=UPI002027202A|nr:hypothetical protein [Actinomadura madurae]URN04406.1 hypothetical protein LUW74_14520 [Actinomadura madurae]
MAGHLGGQFLRQGAQFDACVRVQLVTGDLVRQQRIIVLRRRAFTFLEAGLPVVSLARRPVGAVARALRAPVLPTPVLRTLRPTTAFERLLTLSRTSFALALEPPPAGAAFALPLERTRARASFVTLVTASPGGAVLRASLEAPLTLAAAGLGTTRTPVATRPTALPRPRTTGSGRTPLPALAALASGRPPLSRPSLASTGTVETALAALPAVLTLAARVPLLATTGTTAPALRATGARSTTARSTATGAAALAGSGRRRSLTAAGISPAPRRRVPPPVVAPPLAAVVAAAVLFRAHHVRHCSRWKFGGLFTLL